MSYESDMIKKVMDDADGNIAVSEIVDRILSIPGVYHSVMKEAVNQYGSREMKELYNDGCTQLSDLPRYFIWQTIQEPRA